LNGASSNPLATAVNTLPPIGFREGRRPTPAWRTPILALIGIGVATQLPAALAQPPGRVLAAAPIPLIEPAGMELLIGSRERADYGPLAEQFLTQANLAYCGVASAVMVLNSLAVPAPAVEGYGAYRFWTQANVFDPPATRAFAHPARVAREGMTLPQLHGLLASHGLVVERHHGERLSLEQFRALLRRNLADPGDRLVVNYHRPAVGQAGGGHIAPIAAYHGPTDRVLILDVARYRYPSVWVPVEDLWQAIRAVDASSGRSRGVLVLRRAPFQPGASSGGAAAP
jgi:hypothetical protein